MSAAHTFSVSVCTANTDENIISHQNLCAFREAFIFPDAFQYITYDVQYNNQAKDYFKLSV